MEQRELKFRAWSKLAKCMLIPDALDFELASFRGHRLQDPNLSGSGHLKNLILMQYTGLKDSTGKEIYEGDVVYFKYNAGHVVESFGVVRFGKYLSAYNKFEEAVYVQGFYISQCYKGNEDYQHFDMFDNKYTIRGNIYENPELVK